MLDIDPADPLYLRLAPAASHHPAAPTKGIAGQVSINVPRKKEEAAATLVGLGVTSSRPWRIAGCAELDV